MEPEAPLEPRGRRPPSLGEAGKWTQCWKGPLEAVVPPRAGWVPCEGHSWETSPCRLSLRPHPWLALRVGVGGAVIRGPHQLLRGERASGLSRAIASKREGRRAAGTLDGKQPCSAAARTPAPAQMTAPGPNGPLSSQGRLPGCKLRPGAPRPGCPGPGQPRGGLSSSWGPTHAPTV